MRKLIMLPVLAVVMTLAMGSTYSTKTFVGGGGGSGGANVYYSETTSGEEGTTFTVGANSVAPFAHAIKLEYDYAPGPWGREAATSGVAKYFAQTTGSSNISVSKLVPTLTLWQGDTLTVTVTVAPTLAAVPDSSVTLDTVSQEYIIDHGVETWVFAPSWLASSSSDNYPPAAYIDHLVQDTGDGARWRYGEANEDASNGWGVDYNSAQWRGRSYADEQYLGNASQHRHLLFSAAFDDIPEGCEIVSATMAIYNVSGYAEVMTGTGDGFYVVIDTFAQDWAKMQACATRVGNDQWIQAAWNGPCATAADSASYHDGSLWNRNYYHEYGITEYVNIDGYGVDEWISLDITQTVQMHRELGLGMVPLWLFSQADANGSQLPFTCGPTGSAALQPFIVVRAKPNKQYANIWGDGVIVPLAFSSDDQYAGSNIEWHRVLQEQANTGVTIFVRGDAYDPINYAPENHLTEAQLDSLNQAGADVLGHSLYHGGDVNSYDPNCGSYSFISDWTTGVPGDSLYDDLSHTWLSTIIGETVTGMAWPRHIYSLDLWEYARDSGMLWARDGTNEQFGDCAAVTTAGVDAGEPTYVRTDGTPVAMYALKLDAEGSPGWYAPWDNGAAADAVPVDSTTIAERIRFCIGRATWQGRRPVMLFTHDIRGGNYTAAEGLSAAELEDMIQATPSGAQWTTMSDIMTKFIAGSVACDPPTGSASETYGHTAADLVWRKVQ